MSDDGQNNPATVTDARVAAAVRALQSTDGWSDINARVLHALRASDRAALEAARDARVDTPPPPDLTPPPPCQHQNTPKLCRCAALEAARDFVKESSDD